MIFLTYNDHPSGVFSSQVVDVCRFLRREFGIKVQLVCIFPTKEISNVSEKILKEDPEALILPAKFPLSFPGLNAWSLKKVLKKFKGESVIARGVFACAIALKLKNEGVFSAVAYDGRGAVKAEFEEYIAPGTRLAKIAARLEQVSVLKSDFRIAVTQALVQYWKKEMGYTSDKHVIIPTTLSSEINSEDVSENERTATRSNLGFTKEDIVLVFSGGKADWQSFDLLKKFVADNFPKNEKLKLLLLVPEFPPGEWPHKDRIVQKWVQPKEVRKFLSIGDYGILLREKKITNLVSSPTKFAEYLDAGLKVIISPEVGDSTYMVVKNDLGMVWEEGAELEFGYLISDDRMRSRSFSVENFSKTSHSGNYETLLQVLT